MWSNCGWHLEMMLRWKNIRIDPGSFRPDRTGRRAAPTADRTLVISSTSHTCAALLHHSGCTHVKYRLSSGPFLHLLTFLWRILSNTCTQVLLQLVFNYNNHIRWMQYCLVVCNSGLYVGTVVNCVASAFTGESLQKGHLPCGVWDLYKATCR